MSSFLGVYAVPEEMRCKYPSKRCESARVLKRDGDFHRFCEFHRLKANMNQQRLEQRRRMASPRAASRGQQPQQQRRTKRSMSAPCKPVLGARESASSPTSFFEADEFALPTLEMDDLDLHLLGDLLDGPRHHDPFTVDDTHAALRLLDVEPSYADPMASATPFW